MTDAPDRMDAPRIVRLLVLAHHRPEQLDRCVLVPCGRWRVALCARCLGLYPALVFALAAQLVLRLGPLGALDWWVALLGLVPLVADWGASRLGSRGSNWRRAATGSIGGVALSRSLYLYFRDPAYELLWTQLALLAIAVFAVECVRTLRLGER